MSFGFGVLLAEGADVMTNDSILAPDANPSGCGVRAVDVVVAGRSLIAGDDCLFQRGCATRSEVEATADALAGAAACHPLTSVAALGEIGDDEGVGECESGTGERSGRP
jgi:hypothetical protein